MDGQGMESAPTRSSVGRIVLIAVLLLAAWVGYEAWYNLFRQVPDEEFASAEDQFKYGAIGLPQSAQVPYLIWQVLPRVFADKLPKRGHDWDAFGLIVEPGHDRPVGFARRTKGYPVLEANCALCHTGTVQTDRGRLVIPGGPAHELDLQAFQRFLYACVADPRFSADTLIPEIQKIQPLSWPESLVYRFLIIPGMKKALVQQSAEFAWQNSRPAEGPGRTDTFNPTKINVFHLADDQTIGTTDLPQIWNQRPRQGMYLHWDGNNNVIAQRNYAAAMAIGATPESVIPAHFTAVTNYVLDLKPLPFPFAIDHDAAARGAAVFEATCAECHAIGHPRIGQVEPIAAIGTDRHRLDSFSQALVDKFHETKFGTIITFDAYRKTDGYSSMPLDGIWARGPYLHNGSVPTLWALLQPVEQRPVTFYRGFNGYDATNVGFVTSGPDAERLGALYDTHVPGNANTGHTYGVTLPEASKRDLLEFLKTQ